MHFDLTATCVCLPACRSDEDSSGGDIDWDNLGFGLTPTDYMYVMRCSQGDAGFSRGELSRYGNVELSPSSGVLNYGQVRLQHNSYLTN